jgi:hypothetical protein
MRRGCGIVEPCGERVRLATGDILRGEAAPAFIVAVPQRRFDLGVETQRLSRLAGREWARSARENIGIAGRSRLRGRPTAEASRASSSGNRAARVASEGSCASRSRRAVTGPRAHLAALPWLSLGPPPPSPSPAACGDLPPALMAGLEIRWSSFLTVNDPIITGSPFRTLARSELPTAIRNKPRLGLALTAQVVDPD